MLNKVENCKIERYYYGDLRVNSTGKYLVWYVDVVESDNMGSTVDMFEAWIAPRDHFTQYGRTMYMFGCPKEQKNGENVDRERFLEMVEAEIDAYIDVWYDLEKEKWE